MVVFWVEIILSINNWFEYLRIIELGKKKTERFTIKL